MKNNPISKLGVQKNKVSGIPAQIGIGAGIENSKYQNKSKLVSQTDVDADMYSKMADKFKSKDGGRPRGLWNNFGSGVMEGMAYGARSQGARERKGDYDKYENVMNYFNEVNNAAMEQNAWYEQRAMEMENIRPYAIAGLEVSYSDMDYRTGNERMRNLVEQAKLNNPNIKGDYIGYVPNSPIVNLRDENGNITALSLSTLAGEDSVKRIQGNYIDQQSRNVAQQKEDRELKYAPEKYEAMKQRSENAAERTKQMAQKTYMTALDKYGPKIEAASRVRVISSKMKDLVGKNPGMFQSVLSAVWDSNDPGVLQLLAQKFSNGQNAETIKEMGKYIQELKIGIIKGLAKPNQAIDMIAAGTVPGKGMPDKSILKILDDLDYKAEHEIDLNRDYLNEAKGAFGEDRNGGDVYKDKAEEYIAGALDTDTGRPAAQKPQQAEATIPETTVWIKNPESGEQTEIDEKQLDAAIAAGYQYVEAQNGN